jgi:hypothetical protein
MAGTKALRQESVWWFLRIARRPLWREYLSKKESGEDAIKAKQEAGGLLGPCKPLQPPRLSHSEVQVFSRQLS